MAEIQTYCELVQPKLFIKSDVQLTECASVTATELKLVAMNGMEELHA